VSATREMRQSQRIRGPIGTIAPADTQTLSGRIWAVCVRLRERFGAARFPAYVSAFEGEYVQTLAEWSDCRTDIARQPVIEERQGGARWK